MGAVAIFSADAVLRRGLELLVRGDPRMTLVGAFGDATALRELLARNKVDAVLADAPTREDLAGWKARAGSTAFVLLLDSVDKDGALDALGAGAQAVLHRTAKQSEILAAIEAAVHGLVVVQREMLGPLLDEAPSAGDPLDPAGRTPLTPRELDVLAAMADGASNKAIARRLGISFHTVKFHVAAILAKLDADSRTEAVTKAAQAGLVML
jgi:two-component system, NarL family, response regulator YdfI